MADPPLDRVPAASVPGDRQPKRLLDRAPGERYVPASRDSVSPAPSSFGWSAARGFAAGTGTAAAAALVHTAAATVLGLTAGLLVVAATVGVAIGVAVARAAGPALHPTPRSALAVGLALIAVVAATGANWAMSGMYLGPFDYVAQVYGLLVPLEALLAAAGALIGAR